MEKLNNRNNLSANGKRVMMRIGIATDFGWFELKRKLVEALGVVGYELDDIGDYELIAGENYPDFVVPLAKTLSEENDIQYRTLCAIGNKACTAVNKLPCVCAALITEPAGPCVEDEDLYVRCLGGQVKGYALSKRKVMTFLNAEGPTRIPSNQRLAKVRVLGRAYNLSEKKMHLA